MGRRNRGGRGGGGSLQLTLCRRIESCKSRFRYSSAKEIFNHLRSAYPDEDDDGRSASRKRRNSFDEVEDISQKMEALHIRKRMSKRIRSTSSGYASSESGSGRGGDGAGSEDTAYGEKGEPAFDLVKSSVSNSVGGGGVEVKEKKGPRFKDLGGMKEIFEKLRTVHFWVAV